MRKIGLLGTSALGSFTFIGLSLALAAPAHAQDEPAPDACASLPEGTERDNCLAGETELESGTNVNPTDATDAGITITGSRIRRPNLESTVPITSLAGEEFFQQGQNNIGDTLNELPQLRTTFGQQNAGRFLGTTGLNLLDLRGLGTQRTLVLVNGRRHVPSDILNNGVSPDVNTIPNDLIDRVDIVTGGNSAIYGSDAIAGVVNFVLKRNFEGLQVRGNAGISGYGSGGNQYAAAMYGMNFGDDRGNVTVHAEYAHQDRLHASDVPFLRQVDGFLAVDSDPAGTPNGSDGNPDRVFFRDIRRANINEATQIAFQNRTAAQGQIGGPLCGVGFNGTPFNCVYFFSPDGTQLIQQTGSSRIGTGPIGSFIGGNGTTGRENNLLTIFPDQTRYNANLLAHFTISEALEPFLEAKFVRVDTAGQNAGPAFVQGSTLGDPAQRERIRLDNPFLTAAQRAQITNILLTTGTAPGLSTAPAALTPGQIAAINAGTFRVPIQRNFLDLGLRDEASERETWRVVGGLRGTFNDDWTYEISANYGKVTEDTTVLGNVDLQRLLLSMDAGIDPNNPGAGIQCRSKFDMGPAAQFDYIGDPAKFAADVAACIPYDPFGFDPNTNAAARGYIVRDTISHATLDQLVLSAFVSGDSSQIFEMPGGPIRFALGAEYRREKLFYQADEFIEAGFTFYNALPTFDADPFDVKEAFAEIQIPILKDMPFFHDLSVSAAARVAAYGGGTGTVWAYNAGIEWSPVADIRFRGNYGRSVRAPNLTETAFPLTQNFSPGFTDPCRPSGIGLNPNRPANCLADLGPLLGNLTDIAFSLEFVSGSNPDLEAETSDSYTIGAVIQPRWIPGLSITADYYDITVNNVIATVAAQTIINSCYDQPNLDNPFCSAFERWRGPGPGPNGEVPGAILSGSLTAVPLNFQALVRRGLDIEVAYRRNLGDNVRINSRLIYTHNFQISNFANPAFPDLENRILGELGDPKDEFSFNLDLTVDKVTFGYQARYIGRQVVNLYEDFFPLETACTPAGCPPNDADWADTIWYPSVLYHDARIAFDVTKDYNFYFGVDNFTNRAPPMGLTGVGAGSGIYNVRGRNFYAGFRARF